MPDPEDSSPGSGRLIADRYRLESKLGEGAMGTVWAGVDDLLRRPVAVKEVRLPAGMPEEEAAEIRERALREARAIAVVSHPNVVTLYDVAREEGEPFVVMELVPSQSLAAILNEHASLDDTQLAVIADGVAAALEAAHRTGVIHRDVKPGNVLIGDDGRIKLSDFGISRNVAETTLTQTGIMMGTPAYIAPEIASGETITEAADLWGLGATLFAASEGDPPYDTGDNPLATITEVVRGPVPTPTRGGIISELITSLMVKDPAERLAPQEVRRRVQELLPEPDTHSFESLLDPEAPTLRVRTSAKQSSSDTQEEEPQVSQPAPADVEAAPLAASPGPLPFMPQEPPRSRRPSVIAVLALGLAALVLFAAAVVAGFTGTRTLAGQEILPKPPPPPSAPPPDTGPQLYTRSANTPHEASDSGGGFEIGVPGGWTSFSEEQEDVASSMAVSYISENGHREITAQRFGEFYSNGHSVDDYLDELPEIAAGPEGNFTQTSVEQLGNRGGQEPDRQLTYQISDIGLEGSRNQPLQRSTYMRVMPRDNDLWLVAVTVPRKVAKAGDGAEFFDEVVETFRPTR